MGGSAIVWAALWAVAGIFGLMWAWWDIELKIYRRNHRASFQRHDER